MGALSAISYHQDQQVLERQAVSPTTFVKSSRTIGRDSTGFKVYIILDKDTSRQAATRRYKNVRILQCKNSLQSLRASYEVTRIISTSKRCSNFHNRFQVIARFTIPATSYYQTSHQSSAKNLPATEPSAIDPPVNHHSHTNTPTRQHANTSYQPSIHEPVR